MDIEQMTKAQLVLLALLVSFVTSIATGIATASLLEQAPPEVTRVIDRVVERTVETVTPVPGDDDRVTTETTVVVREDDLITGSVSNISKSLVRIYDTTGGQRTFLGLGFVTTSNGQVLASSNVVIERGVYTLRLANGKEVEAVVSTQNESVGAALLDVIGASSNKDFIPVKFGDPTLVKLGQSVIALSGESDVVSMGIISNIQKSAQGTPLSFETTLSSSAGSGTPLINLFGEVIGFKKTTEGSSFTPISGAFTQ